MTTQTAGTLEVSRVIAADPESVFDAWTRPEHLGKWSAPEGIDVPISEVDLTVGGRFHLRMKNAEGGMHNARGIYREIDRPARLVYSWEWDEHPEYGNPDHREFRAVDGGTQVTMVHSGLPE